MLSKIKLNFTISQRVIFILCVILLCGQNGMSVTRFFEGGDWHNASNWTNDLMPDPGDDVSMFGDGIISQSVDVNNINVAHNKLTISNPVASVNARYLIVLENGELINHGNIYLSKDVGWLRVAGNMTNTGTISFIEDVNITGTSTNWGVITGTSDSSLTVGFDGVFNNRGTITGQIDLINLSNTAVFNNYSPIQLDLALPGNIRLINDAQFINLNVLSANVYISIEDDALFENRKQVDLIHTGSNQFIRLKENGRLKNIGNFRLDQQNGFLFGMTQQDDSQFENHGLFIMENAKFSITPDTTGQAFFRNEPGAQLYISNTDADGIRLGMSKAGQFQNAGLISLCQTNQMSGTCPITASTKTIFENMTSGQFFTGVDIFSSNCSTTVQSSIVNQGAILPGCATDPDFNCLLNYTDLNAITGTISGPQDFEAHFAIESSNALIDMGTVTFDAGRTITLKENFEVNLNTVFEAIIDGCGGI